MPHTRSDQVADINTLSTFLTNSQIPSLKSLPPSSVLVSCVSSVLFPTTSLFTHLQSYPTSVNTLVLCGGVGHSTSHIYSAIKSHPIYHVIYDEIVGLPESRVLERVLDRFYDGEALRGEGLKVLVEERSTNCGMNAVETKRVLDENGIYNPEKIVLYQDCTMSLRTKAGFERVYEGTGTQVSCWTGWTPVVTTNKSGEIVYDVEKIRKETGNEIKEEELWDIERFLGLIVGEIPRFEAYGPRGIGSIVNVVIPGDIRSAWERLETEGIGKRR